MKIAIIGAGNLGLSIASGLLKNNIITQLYLTKRSTEDIQNWSEYKDVIVTNDNVQAVKNSDIIIFAIQPRQIQDILIEIKNILTEKHTVITTVTGFKIHQIEAVLGDSVPIIRSMPNTAISVGKSMTCICANTAGLKRIKIAEAIYNALGSTLAIDEELMQAATVICASGIAFWMRLIRATTQGAIQLGFEAKEAQQLATQTCLGTVSLLLESGNHPEQEIDKVTTPRGCTIEGLNQMEHEGLSSSLIKGLVASFHKINQI